MQGLLIRFQTQKKGGVQPLYNLAGGMWMFLLPYWCALFPVVTATLNVLCFSDLGQGGAVVWISPPWCGCRQRLTLPTSPPETVWVISVSA